MSLPHARGGVSAGTQAGFVSRSVFPTPVGVFLSKRRRASLEASLPHARGGVSKVGPKSAQSPGSSPRPWGCFLPAFSQASPKAVFPTPVGVFLTYQKSKRYRVCLPHARGGVSTRQAGTVTDGESSPRPWGCFDFLRRYLELAKVFPTPVGVFPLVAS